MVVSAAAHPAISAPDDLSQARIALVQSGKIVHAPFDQTMEPVRRLDFDTVSDAQAFAPRTAPNFIRTAGYGSAGDNGGQIYKQVSSEPSHDLKFSITLADGETTVWYEDVGGPFRVPEVGGAVGDVVSGSDGAMTASSATFTSATASFTADDVGKLIVVIGAATDGYPLATTIAGYTNATTITLTAAAGTTVASAAYHYGTDDTEAIQSVIDAGGDIWLAKGKKFGITDELSISTAGQRMWGTGSLVVLSAVNRAVHVTGEGCELEDFTIEGCELARRGIYAPVDDIVIRKVKVFDIYADDDALSSFPGAFAIWVYECAGTVRIEECEVRRVTSEDNGGTGDSIGMARGIMVTPSEGSKIFVERNVLDEIRGEDGDAIGVQNLDTEANAAINHNIISGCDRRAIKTQVQKVDVCFNKYLASGGAPGNASSVISVHYATKCKIIGNTLEAAGFDAGISVGAITGTAYHQQIVRENQVKSDVTQVQGADTVAFAFYDLKGLICRDNTVEGFRGLAKLTNVHRFIIDGIDWRVLGNNALTAGVFDVTTACSQGTISNIRAEADDPDGSVTYLILATELSNCIIKDNVANFATGTAHTTVRLAATTATNNTITGNQNNSNANGTVTGGSIPTGSVINTSRNFGSGGVGNTA